MSDALVTWLRAQLDDDERVARATEATLCREWVGDFREVFTADDEAREVVSGAWSEGVAEHIARHDPARVLAEVDANRRIIDLYEQTDFGDFARRTALEDVIRLRALPRADRPGYQETWRP